MAERTLPPGEILEPNDSDLKEIERENRLLELEPDDLLGRYFKEVSKYPLLKDS